MIRMNEFQTGRTLVEGVDGPLDASLLEFARVATLCNECEVERTEEGAFKSIGAPTEAALKVAADKLITAHDADGEPFQVKRDATQRRGPRWGWSTGHEDPCAGGAWRVDPRLRFSAGDIDIRAHSNSSWEDLPPVVYRVFSGCCLSPQTTPSLPPSFYYM
eukprot:871682-Pyramimonas_sp.AAC.1